MRRFLSICAIAVLVLGAGTSVSYWVYNTQKTELIDEASQQVRRATSSFIYAVNRTFDPILAMSEALRDSDIWRTEAKERERLFFALSAGMVGHYRQISGVFVGFPDGRFLHVQDLRVPGANEPDNDSGERLIGRIIDRPGTDRTGTWRVFDRESGSWKPHSAKAQPYDPRLRPWYRSSTDLKKSLWTEPYVFASSGKLGVTYADPVYDGSGKLLGVIGVDLSLDALSQTLLATSGSLVKVADYVFATDLDERVVGHPDFIRYREQLDEDVKAFLARYNAKGSFEQVLSQRLNRNDDVKIVSVEGSMFLAERAELDPAKSMPLRIYVARDMKKVLATATAEMQRNGILVFAGIVVLGISIAYAAKLRVEMAARRKAELALIEARDVAEDATRAKSAFLAVMSHEIRGPMNGVMSMAELMGLTPLDGEQRWMTKIINDSANALLTIIDDILDFSKIEAGKLDIESVSFSLADVTNGTGELLATRAEEKGLDFIVDIDPALVDRRIGDPTRLKQILLNLGGNAIKFTEAGGVRIEVTASAESPGDRLRFEVHDTGIGLTPDQRERLFQPYVQANASTTRKYGGSGLGLSICQRLVDLMGGRIGVDSRFGQGSVFWFELPLDTVGNAPLQPETDIAAASVRLVGLADPVASVATRYLEAAGISAIARHESLSEARASRADLYIVACTLPNLTGAALSGLDGTVALLGRRTDIAAAASDVRARSACMLPLPVSAKSLWRAAALALGHDVRDELEIDIRDDLGFAPPGVEEARAANALILVVEDNEMNQAVIAKMLSKMGFACEIAENGRVALSMLTVPGHGLVLTDVNMPEMDGFELARTLRENERNNGATGRLPIIALTADALAGTEDTCLEAGMDGYLAKPIDSQELGRLLALHLPQGRALRKTPQPEPDDARLAEPAGAAPEWDPEVFDLQTLADSNGALDQETKDLIRNAADTWIDNLARINAAFAKQDKREARDAVHFLKSASVSMGAKRLGRVASDIQDFLDADDLEMASMMAEVLEPTLEEFRETLPRILRH